MTSNRPLAFMAILSALAGFNGGAVLADADTFDGVYTGATMGYGTFDYRYSFERNDEVVDLIDGASADGFRQGVFLGTGRFFERTYVGFEGDFGLGTHDHRAEFDSMTRMFESELDGSYGLGLRLGYLWSPRTLVYGQAGWQRTRMDYRYEDQAGGRSSGREDFDGYRLSVGTELAFQTNLFLRLDYSVTSFSEEELELTDGDRAFVDPTENLFRIGIGYRF